MGAQSSGGGVRFAYVSPRVTRPRTRTKSDRLTRKTMLSALLKIVISALFICASAFVYGQDKPPGLSAYSPTKLEWAALELQALHGRSLMTHESPLMVTFVPQADGVTVLCYLQYTSDFQAAALKLQRDALEKAFDLYRQSHKWQWLRLRFQERTLSEPWPR